LDAYGAWVPDDAGNGFAQPGSGRPRGKDFIATAELPGFSKTDVNIEVADDSVTISAKKTASEEEKTRITFDAKEPNKPITEESNCLKKWHPTTQKQT
jgi:hypothetical protein